VGASRCLVEAERMVMQVILFNHMVMNRIGHKVLFKTLKLQLPLRHPTVWI
jgi:hypothetical protein